MPKQKTIPELKSEIADNERQLRRSRYTLLPRALRSPRQPTSRVRSRSAASRRDICLFISYTSFQIVCGPIFHQIRREHTGKVPKVLFLQNPMNSDICGHINCVVVVCGRFLPKIVGAVDLFGQACKEALQELDADGGMLVQKAL